MSLTLSQNLEKHTPDFFVLSSNLKVRSHLQKT